jgi:hypothetical protein
VMGILDFFACASFSSPGGYSYVPHIRASLGAGVLHWALPGGGITSNPPESIGTQNITQTEFEAWLVLLDAACTSHGKTREEGYFCGKTHLVRSGHPSAERSRYVAAR